MNKTFRQYCVLILLVAATTLVLAQGSIRRDGNWWRGQTRPSQVEYVIGFFDGMALGHRFSYWKFMQDKNTANAQALVVDSFNEYIDKYFNSVTAGQLVDGLSAFYSDFRNRSIKVNDAVWLVANQIAGTPNAQVNEMIEGWRRNAAR